VVSVGKQLQFGLNFVCESAVSVSSGSEIVTMKVDS
jgi:hypothetical protein